MHHTHADPFITDLTAITGQDPSQCYQCGKCSAGCPVREFAEDAPNRVVRYVQLGMYDRALSSKTIWMCAGCQMCSSRCPKEFDIAKFMDAMREMALSQGIEDPDKKSVAFHKSFLNQIRNHGRSWEMGLIRDYKLKTFELMKDVELAPGMLSRRKLAIFPPNIKDKDSVKKVFKKK